LHQFKSAGVSPQRRPRRKSLILVENYKTKEFVSLECDKQNEQSKVELRANQQGYIYNFLLGVQ